MRARMGLYASGQTVELREIILRDKPAHMLEISPKGTVPVLLLSDGTVIDESLEIMLWALKSSDPAHLLKPDESKMLALIGENDTRFKPALDRYKYPARFEGEDTSAAFENGLAFIETLEARLSQSAQLFGEKPSLADLAIFPFIRQFAHVDRERFAALRLPHTQKWLANHIGASLFTAIMTKFPRWQAGDPPTRFP